MNVSVGCCYGYSVVGYTRVSVWILVSAWLSDNNAVALPSGYSLLH